MKMLVDDTGKSRKVKILIIKDDEDLQNILKLHLTRESFEVLQAFNGKECFDVLKQDRPDLLLLDLMMPEMDGFEVVRRLKSVESASDIPVIIITARGELNDKLKCFSFKADDYVVKPYEFQDLLARIYLGINKMVEAKERRKSEKSRLRRSLMHNLSERPLEIYQTVEEQLSELESNLPADSGIDIGPLKEASFKLVSVIERSHEEYDPGYLSPILEHDPPFSDDDELLFKDGPLLIEDD